MKKHFAIILLLILPALFFLSCEKDPDPTPPDFAEPTGKGLYVLNEGLYNMNNATLTWYDFDTEQAYTDWFELRNGRKLGDTGNDIKIYGGKMYIVVNGSSQVEVLDAFSGESLQQIPLFDGEVARQPRAVAFLHNKAFVCSFDGTVAVIDTTSLEVEKFIPVGRNPDGITTFGNKIYVANSGGLDFPNYDNTVSVIDFQTLQEVKRITVGTNPYTMQSHDNGMIYLIARGNYANEKMRLQIIDSHTDELVHTFDEFEAMSFSVGSDAIYVYYYDFTMGFESSILAIDPETRQVISEYFISDGTEIQTVYGILADRHSGNVFVTDAKGFTSAGKVYCFDAEGNQLYSFSAGINPGPMAILYETAE